MVRQSVEDLCYDDRRMTFKSIAVNLPKFRTLVAKKAKTNSADPDQTASEEAA